MRAVAVYCFCSFVSRADNSGYSLDVCCLVYVQLDWAESALFGDVNESLIWSACGLECCCCLTELLILGHVRQC